DPISPKEKSLWMRELLEAQRAIGDDILHSYIGEEITVLTEAQGREDADTLLARTAGNVPVKFRGSKELIGQFARVKITGATNCMLMGELIF
ncbi:MAG: TRAM domain-containing protein, partial [Angelakisella sp.]